LAERFGATGRSLPCIESCAPFAKQTRKRFELGFGKNRENASRSACTITDLHRNTKDRRTGGIRTGVLPDLFIGAHAAVEELPLLTRDARRYRHYFPTVTLIAPENEE